MSNSKVLVGLQDKKRFWIKLEGDVRVPWCVSLETYCEAVIKQPGITGVCVDLTAAENLDSTTLGVLAKVAIYTRNHCLVSSADSSSCKAILLCHDENILRLVRSMGFESVFDIRDHFDAELLDFDELPLLACTEADMKDAVINAHKTLMEMTEDNRASFGSLVSALEAVDQKK